MKKARYTLVFLAAPDDVETKKASRKPTVELTYNWDPEDQEGGRNFGHLAYAVDDIYALCAQKAGDHQSPTARRPHGLHSHARRHLNELIQKGELKSSAEPGRLRRTSACEGDARSRKQRRIRGLRISRIRSTMKPALSPLNVK